MLAIQEGRDDLAKQALVRHGEHMGHGTTLEQTWEAHRMETEKWAKVVKGIGATAE